MKNLLFMLALVPSLASGALINVVSFSYDDGVPPPAEYYDFIHKAAGPNLLFFDDAQADGWTSKYGVLDGGQYFFTDFDAGDSSAEVSWDFTGDDHWLRYIDVFGRDSTGLAWTSLYEVRGRFPDLGTVAINGDIFSIAFYGTDPEHVPDWDSTFALFCIGLFGAVIMKRREA